MSKAKHEYIDFGENFKLRGEKAKDNSYFFQEFIKKLKDKKIKILDHDENKKTIKILFRKNIETGLILKVVFSGNTEDIKKLRVQIPAKVIEANRIIGIHENTKTHFVFTKDVQTGSRSVSSFGIPLGYFPYFKENGPFKIEKNRNKRPVTVFVLQSIFKIIKENQFFEKKTPAYDSKKEKNVSQKLEKNIKNMLLKRKNIYEFTEEEKETFGEEKRTEVGVRKNQSVFRDKLLKKGNKTCPISLIKHEEILIASHLKPGKVCEKKEKLDSGNGILLSPLFDKLLDKGYITFSNDGKIIYSNKLSRSTKEYSKKQIKNIKYKGEIKDKTKTKFLKYHRDKIFKK